MNDFATSRRADRIGEGRERETTEEELTSLEESLPNLKNLHVEAISENNTIIFMHKVKVGPTDQSYGINVASLAKIPEL